MTEVHNTPTDFDLAALAKSARAASQPAFFPLAAFAALGIVELAFRISAFGLSDISGPIGFVWFAAPLIFVMTWVRYRNSEQRTGIRASSNAWGWVALGMIVAMLPIGMLLAVMGGGPLISAVGLLLVATVQRNQFLLRTSLGLLAVAVAVLVAQYTALTSVATNVICTVGTTCQDAQGASPSVAVVTLFALAVPAAFLVTALRAHRRENCGR